MKDTSSDISDEFTSTLAQQYSKIEDLEADFEQKVCYYPFLLNDFNH